MSISLNVVRLAAVFCDSFSRSAVLRRIGFILMRVTPPSAMLSAGAGAALGASVLAAGLVSALAGFSAAGFAGAGAALGASGAGAALAAAAP